MPMSLSLRSIQSDVNNKVYFRKGYQHMNLQNGPDIRREELCKKGRISANPLNPAKQENYQHQNVHVLKRMVIQNNR